jgi:Skp family chaperone for outer membrane proteins
VLFSRLTKLLIVPALALAEAPALAQSSSPGYFIPPSPGQAAPAAPAPVHHESEAPSAQPAPAPIGADTAAADAADAQAQPQLPPIPQLPALPKGAPPPTPVIGVLSVPEVMQKSTAAQGVQAIIQDRRAKLADEARRDQEGWQKEQSAIEAERAKLSEADLEGKEKHLQDEIAAAQTSFRARDQAIQNSAQAALGQIESVLIAVIRQVSEARGMNLVLHREQVALNVNAFDITDDVVTQLNKLLPSVPVPPSVVTPGMPISNAEEDGGGQDDGQ